MMISRLGWGELSVDAKRKKKMKKREKESLRFLKRAAVQAFP